VGVWVGNADGAPMWDVSGVTGAAPAWNAIVN
jgi:penicillin-binding protein 1C